ncbi:hypothetical protein TNCT_505711 [Trichonephila clavata]|uniref:Uncharacterized protein n=1 Tax=Trichonephila clavata TaxID=2740835 RepID=A0A8X6I314_TRICU|nr:hypothetical protein TNCT_505711 [Trichonephila clavata]
MSHLTSSVICTSEGGHSTEVKSLLSKSWNNDTSVGEYFSQIGLGCKVQLLLLEDQQGNVDLKDVFFDEGLPCSF